MIALHKKRTHNPAIRAEIVSSKEPASVLAMRNWLGVKPSATQSSRPIRAIPISSSWLHE